MKGEIEIDHIVPIKSFCFNSPDDKEFKKCWALSNLRPMWATNRVINGVLYEGNLNKGKKLN